MSGQVPDVTGGSQTLDRGANEDAAAASRTNQGNGQSSRRGRPRYIPYSGGLAPNSHRSAAEVLTASMNNMSLGGRSAASTTAQNIPGSLDSESTRQTNNFQGSSNRQEQAGTSHWRGGRGRGRAGPNHNSSGNFRGPYSHRDDTQVQGTRGNWRGRGGQRGRGGNARRESARPSKPKSETYIAQSGPKYFESSFFPFQRLPNEIKARIIELHIVSNPRLIELEHDLNSNETYFLGRHEAFRVSDASRVLPSILGVNQFFRAEGLLHYKPRYFDTRDRQKERPVYFCNDVDILLFGEETCTVTICAMLQRDNVALGNGSIPNIALICSNRGELCCSLDDITYGVDGGVNTFQALHGFGKPIKHGSQWTVKTPPKDIYFVVKSNLWYHAAKEMHEYVGLRPAHNEGLTTGQNRFKAWATRGIAATQREEGISGVGKNLWIGEKMPNFHFVGYCPKIWGDDPRVYDAMCVPIGKYKLLTNSWLRDLERTTRVKIIRAISPNPREDPREYGFFGEQAGIDTAKAAITTLIS